MPTSSRKSLMRSLGEFVGHIAHGLRTDPAGERRVVRHETEEEDRDGVILRRTTIEEIELKQPASSSTTSKQP